MKKLAELDIENAAIEWFEDLGYSFIHGPEIDRPLKEVVLQARLKSFLSNTYPQLPEKSLNEVLIILLGNKELELDYRNREFHLKLTKGIDYSWKDKQGREHFEHIYPINYQDPEQNDFLCVNQFPIQGKNNRRPDLIIFVNGLPLAVFEFKNPFDPNTTVDNAWNQIQHYRADIPLLFEYNALTVISDGTTTLNGMYSSGKEWFAPWKSTDGLNVSDESHALRSLLYGLFPKDRFCSYIKQFIFHENHSGTLVKKGAKYHQFFGVSAAVEQTKKAVKPKGDGRIGVIWHTQGAGKSISMAI